MTDVLQLTRNAQFYKPDARLTDEQMSLILGEACSNKVESANFILNITRDIRRVNNTSGNVDFEYTFSARVFETNRPVYFLSSNEVLDTIHAFIAIFEIDGYIAVIKQSSGKLSDQNESLLNLVSNDQVLKVFDDNDVRFQKLSLRNMTLSDRAVRFRSYEAADLKGLLSTHAAGRSIPAFLKVKKGSLTKTITPSTARVVESSSRHGVDELAKWLRLTITALSRNIANKTFLNTFAKSLKLKDITTQNINPISIMIEASQLEDELNDNPSIKLKRQKKNTLVDLSNNLSKKIFEELDEVFELDAQLKLVKYPSSAVKVNQKSITFTSKTLKSIRIIEGNKEESLLNFIIQNKLYSICFENPKYMYYQGMCFEDVSGISEIPSLISLFEVKLPLVNVDSEKGIFTTQMTSFDTSSVFNIVEVMHSNDDFVFCDDLGNEWADHITLDARSNTISFIHSKYGQSSLSASNFHEVVGQGIKNLGNMFFSESEFIAKSGVFNRTYKSGSGVQTQIPRVRKGQINNLSSSLRGMLADPRLLRQCILVCPFISLDAVTREFTKIQANQRVRGNITQMLWIISSFAHAAKEMNVIPKIYCNP